jgi:hypothetical protein
MPQGRVRFIVETAPRRPVRKPPQLMLAYSGPPIVETPAERLQRIERIVRERCAGYLTEDDLALVIKGASEAEIAMTSRPSGPHRPKRVKRRRASSSPHKPVQPPKPPALPGQRKRRGQNV